MCQLETPIQATLSALRRFKTGISILNAAPAPSETTLELYTLPSILCVNQIEAAAMSKRAVPDIVYDHLSVPNVGIDPSANVYFEYAISEKRNVQ